MTNGTTSTTTTAAPPQSTTNAPAQSTTEAVQSTTASPSGSTTASPGPSTTTAPGASTTSSGGGGASFAEGSVTIDIDPDPGIQQQPGSVQVPTDATLTLKWQATNAASVSIEPGSTGLPASGSQSIPTSEQTYTLTAVDSSGAQSSPFTIAVHTHDPDEVVSGHAMVGSGATTTTLPPSTTTEPGTTTTLPPSTTTEPSTTTTAPFSTTTSPGSTTTAPGTTTTAPSSTTTHSTTTTQPPSTTTEPGLNGDNIFELASELLGHDGEPLSDPSSTTTHA